MSKSKFAIEIIGYKHKHYCIKQVINSGLVMPVSKPFRTQEAAQNEADRLGIQIDVVGDLYEIIR